MGDGLWVMMEKRLDREAKEIHLIWATPYMYIYNCSNSRRDSISRDLEDCPCVALEWILSTLVPRGILLKW